MDDFAAWCLHCEQPVKDAHHGAYCSETCALEAVVAPAVPAVVSAPVAVTEPPTTTARRKARGATSWQTWLRERSQDRDRPATGTRRESIDRSETDSMTGGTMTSTDDSSVIGAGDDDSDGVNLFASRRPPASTVAAPKPINGATPPRPPHLSAFASRTVPNVRSPGLRRRDVYDPTTPVPPVATTFYPHAHGAATSTATTSESRLVAPSSRTRSSRKLFMATGRDRFFDDDSDPEPSMAERERTARAFIEHAAQSSMQLFRRARHRQRAPSRHSSSSDRGAPSPDPPASSTARPTPSKPRKSTSFFLGSHGADADSDGEVEHIEDVAAHHPPASRSAASSGAGSAWARPLASIRRISSGQRTPTGPASTSNGLSVWSMAELSLDNDSTPSPTSEQPPSASAVKAVPRALTMTRGRSSGVPVAAAMVEDDGERRGRSRRPRSVSLSMKPSVAAP